MTDARSIRPAVSRTTPATPLVISTPEIAELAGVRRPVVTTWRRRHPSFPDPVGGDSSRPLFDPSEVADWLVTTGRAERDQIEPDLRLYALAGLGAAFSGRELIELATALICLRHLDDDEPLADGTDDVAGLTERAASVDPGDELLFSEVERLPGDAGWLAAAVDDLVEAAWGCRTAVERLMGVRNRINAAGIDTEGVTPELARLSAELSGARERARVAGPLCVTDLAAGCGDLLAAVARTLGDDYDVMCTAAAADPFLARLVRRRLVVHGIPSIDIDVRVGDDLPDDSGDPDAIVTRIPYAAGEDRAPTEVLDTVDDISLRLRPGRAAVVLGPADVLVGELRPYSPEERHRAALLTSNTVEAVVRLPGGLAPFRPGYEMGLWVLTPAYESRWRGRVLVADIADRELTGEVVDALVQDVVTWRRAGYRPDAHTRVHAVQVDVRALVEPPRALTAHRRLSAREVDATGAARVASMTRFEAELDRLGAEATAVRRPVRAGLGAGTVARPASATIGELARRRRLRVVQGSRLQSADIGAAGHHDVLGPAEVLGQRRRGMRRIDRAALADRYPRVRLTEPGDVVVTTAPEVGVFVDHAGLSVVEFPARALRIPAAESEQFTPRVLAALLAAGSCGVRPAGAVRPALRLEEHTVALLDAAAVRRLDAFLADVDIRRDVAAHEIDALDELRRTATAGLTDGTLAFTGDPTSPTGTT